MEDRIRRWLPPEGEDPRALEEEVAAMWERIVDMEREFVDTDAALRALESRIHAEVQSLYEELGDLEARIAEEWAAANPKDRMLAARARLLREKAKAAARSAAAARRQRLDVPAPSEEMKSAYRIARQLERLRAGDVPETLDPIVTDLREWIERARAELERLLVRDRR